MKTPFTRAMRMNFYRLRQARGWSQQRLADEAGVDLTTVQRWESERSLPDAFDLWKLAIALRVPMEELYRGLPRQMDALEQLHPRKAEVASPLS